MGESSALVASVGLFAVLLVHSGTARELSFLGSEVQTEVVLGEFGVQDERFVNQSIVYVYQFSFNRSEIRNETFVRYIFDFVMQGDNELSLM